MSASTSSLLSRGRNPAAGCGPIPRGEKRRREIATVAEQVFLENGFTETTMQTIAARAGASKETLYRHFGNKEELFAEIVMNRSKGFLDGLDENFDRPGSVSDVLHDVGGKLFRAMVDPYAISLCRTVVAESPRNPEIGRIFFAKGPERVRLRLADFLKAATARGELSCGDPGLAARIFLGAIISTFHLTNLILQEPPSMSPAQLKAHVDEAVLVFLGRYARA